MSNLAKTTTRPQFSTLVNTVEVTYDATVDGGAIGNVTLPFKLNPGEIVSFAFAKVGTAFASGGSATVGLGFTATAQELLTDAAYTGLTANANKALVPVGSVATFYENTTTSPQQLQAIIKVAALTAGTLKIFMDLRRPY